MILSIILCIVIVVAVFLFVGLIEEDDGYGE